MNAGESTPTIDPWGNDNISPETKDAWLDVFADLYGADLIDTYSARAHRLHSYGWHPHHFHDICTNPADANTFDDAASISADEAEAHAALLFEITNYFTYWTSIVTYERNRYVRRLAEQNWDTRRIATLLSITPDQAESIVVNQPTLDEETPPGLPSMRPGPPDGRGQA